MASRRIKDTPVSTTDRLRRRRRGAGPTDKGTGRSPTHVIVIGTSSGGRKALKEVFRGLPFDIPAALIVTQHMAALGPSQYGRGQFGDWLRDVTDVPVRLIDSHAPIQSGVLYVTPPGMSARLDRARFHITPYEDATAPSNPINTLFESAASQYGDRVIGVILTGLLRDGTAGLRAVHEAGGLTIVQDPANAEFSSMPASAMQDLPVTFCLNLPEIGPTLDLLVRRRAGIETGLAVSVRLLKQRAELLVRLIAQSERNPQTLHYLTAELHALQLDLRSIQQLVNKRSIP